AHHWYAHLLMYLGRSDEALREARKMVELDPLSPAANLHLGYQYQSTRDWDQSIAQQKKTLQLDPNYVDAHRELGEDYLGKGMYPEAIGELRRATDLVRSQLLLGIGRLCRQIQFLSRLSGPLLPSKRKDEHEEKRPFAYRSVSLCCVG